MWLVPNFAKTQRVWLSQHYDRIHTDCSLWQSGCCELSTRFGKFSWLLAMCEESTQQQLQHVLRTVTTDSYGEVCRTKHATPTTNANGRTKGAKLSVQRNLLWSFFCCRWVAFGKGDFDVADVCSTGAHIAIQAVREIEQTLESAVRQRAADPNRMYVPGDAFSFWRAHNSRFLKLARRARISGFWNIHTWERITTTSGRVQRSAGYGLYGEYGKYAFFYLFPFCLRRWFTAISVGCAGVCECLRSTYCSLH